jgi:cytochrome c oxidase cbb3-type subunit 4
MDMGTFRGIMTAILMTLFVAVVIWAYSSKRGADFEAASRLPLDDDPDQPADRRNG